MASRVEKAALWLMPAGEIAGYLDSWIARLADRFRTERFPPHVTLLAGLSGEEDALVDATRRAAASIPPVPVHIDTIEGRDEHYRCLYVRVAEPAKVAAAHARAAEAFSRAADPDFFPHVSLVYGTLPPEKKRDVAHEAGSDLDLRFEARTLHLWSAPGGVDTWREIAVVPLAGGSGS
jgi:2'-5' RNA ligase